MPEDKEKKFLLRIEAVNFDNFVYDTYNIKAIRGGSFLILDAVQKLGQKEIPINNRTIKLSKITAGASIGLYSFDANDDEEAKKVEAEVLKQVHENTRTSISWQNPTYEGIDHATFVCDVIEEKNEEDFAENLKLLLAKNRFKQFKQPTIILPGKYKNGTKPEDTKPCALDGLRPAVVPKMLPEQDKIVSGSVGFRVQKGRELRKELLPKLIKSKVAIDFTNDLEELACNSDMKGLDGKIAFIYLDGNKFGKIKDRLLAEPEPKSQSELESKLKSLGERIETPRIKFLEELLKAAANDKDFKNTKTKRDKKEIPLRLELLLWGGDDIELVVPAWKGWEVLKRFYESTKDSAFGDLQLTHAGGIVFCHHDAPILHIRKLAKELSDKAKECNSKELEHSEHDAFHYLVLESFDNVGSDLDSFIKRYYPQGAFKKMLVTRPDMDEIDGVLTAMKKSSFPRNKLYDICRIVVNNYPYQKDDIEKIKKIVKRATNELNQDCRDKINNYTLFEGKEEEATNLLHRWIMLNELWDYLGNKEEARTETHAASGKTGDPETRGGE